MAGSETDCPSASSLEHVSHWWATVRMRRAETYDKLGAGTCGLCLVLEESLRPPTLTMKSNCECLLSWSRE